MKTIIVCLCGSTKFREAFEEANKKLTLDGAIVLTVGFFGHSDVSPPTPEQKLKLDQLHLRKIDLADTVHVLNVGGYIGESTSREIAYALWKGKEITFYDERAGEKYLSDNAHELGLLVAKLQFPRPHNASADTEENGGEFR